MPQKNPPNLSRFFWGIFCLFLGKKKTTKMDKARPKWEGLPIYIYIYISLSLSLSRSLALSLSLSLSVSIRVSLSLSLSSRVSLSLSLYISLSSHLISSHLLSSIFHRAAKGVRQKEFDHFFSFSGRFWSLFGHFFWRFCHFFRHFFARLLLPDSFCGRVNFIKSKHIRDTHIKN